MRPARPARPRLVSGSCSSARSFAPRFLPTLGRPHAVALRFTRRDQLVTGLSPAGTRPCRTHLAALAFRELRSDNRCENEDVRAGARGPGNCAPRRSTMRPRTPTGHALARDTVAGEENPLCLSLTHTPTASARARALPRAGASEAPRAEPSRPACAQRTLRPSDSGRLSERSSHRERSEFRPARPRG